MQVFHKSVYSMGTRFNLVLPGWNDQKGSELFADVHKELNRLENMMSCFINSSEISYLNQHAHAKAVIVSEELFNILTTCKEYHHSTFGLFDVGIGKQIDFWKRNAGNPQKVSCPFNAGVKDIQFDPSDKSVFFKHKDVKINLGGYGKGYAIDGITKLLKEQGVKSALVSFGESSIAGIGSHPHGDSWPIGVEDHLKKKNVLYAFRLKDSALSTSGSTEHPVPLMDPLLGLPVKYPCIVSVKSSSASEAEVWSTALTYADENSFRDLTGSQKKMEITKAVYKDGNWIFWEN